MEKFLDDARALFEYTRDLRRDFHKHPEIGFKEIRTANIIAKELTNMGMEVKTGVGQTGVVALLEGKELVRLYCYDLIWTRSQSRKKPELNTPQLMRELCMRVDTMVMLRLD